jgi:hypothetical protein
MEQILLHLIGDYVTQTNKMAMYKASSWLWASLHGLIYALPFLLVGSSIAVLVIGLTHILIDHYRLARFVIFARNWITEPHLNWEDCRNTGFTSKMPDYLAVWLLIITDNVLHLVINYGALRWL